MHDSRTPDDGSWGVIALHAAACCTSATDPVMFICAAGCERWFGEEGAESMYFRKVHIRRFPIEYKMILDMYFLTGIVVPSECTWAGNER